MKVYLDNNSISYLINSSKWSDCLRKLRALVEGNRIQLLGSITVLKELSGFAESDPISYLNTLNIYREMANNCFLREWNELVQQEVKLRNGISIDKLYYSNKDIDDIFYELQDVDNAINTYNYVKKEKSSYMVQMNNAADSLLSDPKIANASPKERKAIVKEWFHKFDNYAQSHFEQIFKINDSYSYTKLPHVRSLINYYLTRTFERFVNNKIDRESDYHDRAHFTEATTSDILISCDQPFLATCKLVPFKCYEVKDLKAFYILLNDMYAT